MHVPEAARKPALVVLVLLVLAATVVGVLRSRQHVTVVHGLPGSFTGLAFDACQTPSQQEMDAWRTASPYSGVGFYVSGDNRACSAQPHLSADWVATQAGKGWRLLPITVGRQASCSTLDATKVADAPQGSYAAARNQGQVEADDAVQAAGKIGIGTRSVLWLDVEAFDTGSTRCRRSMLAYVAGWTRGLHQRHYRSGVYSSAASGMRMLDGARRSGLGGLPDLVWYADWNGNADTRSPHLAVDGWSGHRRVHQFLGNRTETYGGVSLEIDADFMDTGRGSVAPPQGRHCGVPVDLTRYPSLAANSHGTAVAALQCFLRQQGFAAPLTRTYDAATTTAVTRLQDRHGLPTTGAVTRTDWIMLLTGGTTPLLKAGSASDAVRRLQRALVADGLQLPVTGVVGPRTTRAVQSYQRDVGQEATGVVTPDLWVLLQRGRH